MMHEVGLVTQKKFDSLSGKLVDVSVPGPLACLLDIHSQRSLLGHVTGLQALLERSIQVTIGLYLLDRNTAGLQPLAFCFSKIAPQIRNVGCLALLVLGSPGCLMQVHEPLTSNPLARCQ